MNNPLFKSALAGSIAASMLVMTGCQQEQQTMSQAVHQLHLDSATTFAEKTATFDKQLELLCRAPAETSLKQAQGGWLQAMQSWMALQGREKGSEAALALSWQIQFWPDKKNTTGRKLQQLLKQPQQWQPEQLAVQSVVVQGLGAAEWFLFDQQSPLVMGRDKTGYCDLLTAVGGRIADSGKGLEQAWQTNPWRELPATMALAEYLGAINNQLDYTMKKLSRPLGKPGSPKVYQAESWRSQTSMLNLKANVVAMQQLYLANGKGLDQLLRKQGYSGTADRIANRFTSLVEAWPASPAMVPMLKTKAGYRELLNIYNGLEYIQIALQDEVAPELGIVVGFNATDGD
ncbi:imelysin family protein [Photobacterium jeanii]|nr:imelysin family protein [Photobacterium jeanii]